MMRNRSLATLAVGGVRRKSASNPMSASEHAWQKALLRLVHEAKWQRLTQQSSHCVIVRARSIACVVENDGHTRVGGGEHVGGLRDDADDIQTEDLLDVVDAHHLARRDPSGTVT